MKIINKVPSAQMNKDETHYIAQPKKKVGSLIVARFFIFSHKNPIDGYACTGAHAWVYVIDRS